MFDNEEIDIPCAECGHENSQLVAWIRANDQLPCKRCGNAIALEDEKHLLTIEQATHNITKLRRSLAKFRNYTLGTPRKRR